MTAAVSRNFLRLGRLLGKQTLYCLSGLIVNAGPMLVRKRTNFPFPRSGYTDLMAPVPSCCRAKDLLTQTLMRGTLDFRNAHDAMHIAR